MVCNVVLLNKVGALTQKKRRSELTLASNSVSVNAKLFRLVMLELSDVKAMVNRTAHSRVMVQGNYDYIDL